MKITRKDLEKSQIELTVEVSVEELAPFIQKGAESLSKEVKIEGFRPGKVPFDVLKQKIGEMSIFEEAARLLVNKQIYQVIKENIGDKEIIGQPEVNISKLAPGNPLEYKVKVSILPEISVGTYKDLKIKAEELKVESAEVDKVLNDLVEMRAIEKISEKAIKDGDKVISAVNLFLDNVPVEDGQNPEVTILIGKNYFVEGFDKNLIGLKRGEKKEFSIVYPESHWKKNLAGKKVDFKIEIKEIYSRDLPEINDDLAKIFRFKNLKELKDNLEKTIGDQKKKELDQKNEVKIIDKILEKSKFGDIAEDLIKNESHLMVREIEQNVTSQGGKFEDYLSSLGKNYDQLMLDLLPNAVKRVKSALVFKEIAKIEKIKVEEKEIDREMQLLKERYKGNSEVLANISGASYRAYLSNFILNQKVIDNLKKWNLV
ncbi:MAG: trigger factor [Patescibacteria group bacterium]|nr:trigger factor [Patescibacteria group bacterium]